MKVRRRMRNGVNVRCGVRNGVQVIAVLLVVDVSLRVGNVVSVRFCMQMAARLIARTIRLMALDRAVLLDAVPIEHSSLLWQVLLRVRLTLNVPLLRVPIDHSRLLWKRLLWIRLTLNVLLLSVLALNYRALNHRTS